MKKILLYAAFAAAVLSSCSKENIQSSANPEEPWMSDVTLPVPVRFGTAMTKAPVNSVADFSGKIGVFGLDKEAPEWRDGTGENFIYNVGGSISHEGAVTLDKTYYYPIVSDQNFNFYSYYPKQEKISFTSAENGSEFNVILTLDGKTDVMWAKAVAEPKEITTEKETTTYEGYNARYIRKGGTAPSFDFKHMLAQLDFKMKFKGKPSSEVDFKVKNISILNQPNQVKLCIADNKMATTEGTLVAAGENQPLIIESGYTKSITSLSSEAVADICTALVYTAGKSTVEYNVQVKVEVGTTDNLHTENLNFPISMAGGFLPGNKYTINVLVTDPEKFTATANVQAWGNGESQDVDLENLPIK